ncbi:MAG: SBBP repeat-containing protein [bacterium]|nr:SBBP repeat-containing protein [bacterium]
MWIRRYNGESNYYDYASSITVDGKGNAYVTGRSYASGNAWDYATIKYDSLGDTMWVRRYNGPASGKDEANAIAVDGNGNVYVTGSSVGSVTGYDYATIKYDSLGNTRWVRRYNGSADSTDSATAITLDGNGNVYVTGSSVDSVTGYDYATIKYDSLGDTIWIRRYNGPGNDFDKANAIVLDEDGNVYVTGYSDSLYGFYYADYATIKYTCAGVEENLDSGRQELRNLELKIGQNPFTQSTVITYHLSMNVVSTSGGFSLAIHDLSGRIVKTLVNGQKPAGDYTTILNAKGLKTGVYFLTLNANGTKTTKKLTVIR